MIASLPVIFLLLSTTRARSEHCEDVKRLDAAWGPYSHLSHRFSNVMTYGGLVYVSGQVGFASADGAVGDITQQTNATLRAVDDALASAGTSSDRVLEVTIWLANIERDYAAMNTVYDLWVDGHAPTRACIEAKCAGSQMRSPLPHYPSRSLP